MGRLETFELEQLKTLNEKELKELAQEIRQTIIETVSQNGGHLSANLGVVELTIALHKVFNSPYDKIIFDVSHQCYTHKILTGRYREFESLRKKDGISGFTKYSESPHDVFEAGHSSTSLSAGIGMLYAKEYNSTIGDVIAVIGDASVTNGLAFEALNILGASHDKKMIIIINDNEMSISKNVGTLARTFNKIRVRRLNSFVYKITPRFMHKFFNRVNSSIKSFIYGANVFEAFNFKYFEGIDGHNIKELERYLLFAKKAKQSVVLHIKTQKGRGYKYAEEDNTGIWHNAPPFDIESGHFKTSTAANVGEAIGLHLTSVVEQFPNLKVITPGMSLGSGLNYFKSCCPKQFIDVGIAEEHAVVLAGSMAINGLKPIVFLYATFAQRSFDQIVHDVARANTPVVFCIDRAGIVAGDGDTHQGILDIGFLSVIPGVKILAPATIQEAKKMVTLALKEPDGPIFIRYPKSLPEGNEINESLPFSKWDVVLPISSHNIITYGEDVYAIKALIEEHHLPWGLINARFIKPLDEAILTKVINESHHLVIYEQVVKDGSLYQQVLPYTITNSQITVTSFSLPQTYLETGSVDELKKKYHISYSDLLNLLRKM